MGVWRLLLTIIVTGALCVLILPVIGAVIVGPDAGRWVAGACIFILWPYLIYRESKRANQGQGE